MCDIDVYAEWLQAAAKSPLTIYLRKWQLRRFADWQPGSLRSVTTTDLARYLASMDWSPATLASTRATFCSFYGWMCTTGRIRRSPAADLPIVRVPRRSPRPAPDDVIAAAHTDDRSRLMLDLASREGLRRAEIAAIHSRDLQPDPEGGWLLIVRGKGNKERTIPLHPDIAARLRRSRGWIFPSPRGGHLTPNTVGMIITRAMPPGWTAHSLRRRFATVTWRGGHDIKAVQRLLGHASVATTEAYIGVRQSDLRDALQWTA